MLETACNDPGMHNIPRSELTRIWTASPQGRESPEVIVAMGELARRAVEGRKR